MKYSTFYALISLVTFLLGLSAITTRRFGKAGFDTVGEPAVFMGYILVAVALFYLLFAFKLRLLGSPEDDLQEEDHQASRKSDELAGIRFIGQFPSGKPFEIKELDIPALVRRVDTRKDAFLLIQDTLQNTTLTLRSQGHTVMPIFEANGCKYHLYSEIPETELKQMVLDFIETPATFHHLYDWKVMH